MSDYLINLGQNKTLKSLLGSVGISTPQELNRQEGPWKEKNLSGKNILTGYGADSLLENVLPKIYEKLDAGADFKDNNDVNSFNGLVFDATGIKTVDQLSELYQFYHDSVRKIAKCGRVLIINQEPQKTASANEKAVFQAMEGFMRSVSKEIGRKGATANMVQLSGNTATEQRLLPVLHFMLSDGPAFVDAQVIRLSAKVALPQTIPLSQPLTGKKALVTGAAKGIGEATARTLAREGAEVLIVDVPPLENKAQTVCDDIQGKLLPMDITQDDAPSKIKAFLEKEFGGVDIVIHNAGITRDKTLGKMSHKQWESVLNVNLQAILNMNKTIVPETMNENGRMICLSSISGFAGNFGQTNYASTKAAIIGYVKALSNETAAKNITVNAVAPGFIESDMTAKMPFMTKEFARRLSNLSQGGVPQDIAEVITFLASPGAGSITGETVRICGGSLIGA